MEEKEELEEQEKKLENEAQVVDSEVKLTPYNIFGTNLSTDDPDYIEFYKNYEKFVIWQNKLIGKITDGKYTVSKDVKKDLVKIEKGIEDNDEMFYIASTIFMGKIFYFRVEISNINDGKATADLYLFENVGDFVESGFISTHVASYEDVYDENYRIKLRKVFNLVDVPRKMQGYEVSSLATAVQSAIDKSEEISWLYDKACQEYILKILEILKGCGVQGEKILLDYKREAGELNEKESRYNIRMKVLLDKIILKNGGLKALNKEMEIKSAVKAFNSKIKQIEAYQSRPTAIEAVTPEKKADPKPEVKKEEKKEEKKSSSSSKPSKPSKSPEKKDEKPEVKKDDGKKNNKVVEESKGDGVIWKTDEPKKESPVSTDENKKTPSAPKREDKSKKKTPNEQELEEENRNLDFLDDDEMEKVEKNNENLVKIHNEEQAKREVTGVSEEAQETIEEIYEEITISSSYEEITIVPNFDEDSFDYSAYLKGKNNNSNSKDNLENVDMENDIDENSI